jgi:hypothetical protein
MAGDGECDSAQTGTTTAGMIRVERKKMSTNSYDRRDPHVIEASDESTVQKTRASVEPLDYFCSAVKVRTGRTDGLLFRCVGAVERGSV